MIFGWGRGGFGGFGGGGASTDPGLQGLATRADVNEAIAFNGVSAASLLSSRASVTAPMP